MDQQLEMCVQYFVSGGVFEWVVGGAFVLAVVVFSFTKKNFVSIIKGVLGNLLKKK